MVAVYVFTVFQQDYIAKITSSRLYAETRATFVINLHFDIENTNSKQNASASCLTYSATENWNQCITRKYCLNRQTAN